MALDGDIRDGIHDTPYGGTGVGACEPGTGIRADMRGELIPLCGGALWEGEWVEL
jgi:hypothetical protein